MSTTSIVENLRAAVYGSRELEEEYGREKFYGVVTGTVMNLADPMTLGRVQVQLPFIDDIDLSPWARVATPMAGLTSGTYLLPNVGDEVLVAFEHGDVNAPYILGGLWNAKSPPPLPSPLAQIRAIRTLAGNQIVITETPPAIFIQSGPTPPTTIPALPTPAGPPTISLSNSGIQIIAGANTINVMISPASVQIHSGDNVVSLAPDGISISSLKNLNIKASGSLNISAGLTCSITAPTVRINS